jgi:hypothetical protein
MHIKLQNQMVWWLDELKDYANHVEYWFKKIWNMIVWT